MEHKNYSPRNNQNRSNSHNGSNEFHKSQKSRERNNKSPKPVTLPYDFIPFAQDTIDGYYMPYEQDKLPLHNETAHSERFSGSIDYCIYPQGDLVLELKEVEMPMHDKHQGKNREVDKFMSGSQIRGKIRSNVEILSGSFPVFVDRTELLYRNVTSKRYKNKLKEIAGIDPEINAMESIVRAGYLEYRNGEYVIIPAKQFGSKHFLALKEYELIQMDALNETQSFYKWSSESKKVFADKTKDIDRLSGEIKKYQNILKEKHREKWVDQLSEVFQEYSFTKLNSLFKKEGYMVNKYTKYNEMRNYIEKLAKSLQNKLKTSMASLLPKDSRFEELISRKVDRWKLKAELHYYYEKELKKNSEYEPYEHNIFFECSSANKITNLVKGAPVNKNMLKGYLFSSSNASSKRTHYVINERIDSNAGIVVEQHTINAYNELHGKMRFNSWQNDKTKGQQSKEKEEQKRLREQRMKEFYDLFPSADQNKKPVSKIVFFLEVNDQATGEKRLYLGRTPHFRIGYDYQLKELLQNKVANQARGLDYARALFGFTADDLEDIQNVDKMAYKSRLRFSALKLEGMAPQPQEKAFLLASPAVTAEGMYIRASKKKGGKATYERRENADMPIVNGHKIYHILERAQPYLPSSKTTEKVESRKHVYPFTTSDHFYFQGKVHFTNLSAQELGLLILALDISKLRSSEYYALNDKYKKLLEKELYEQIGGAKPYGYGKVKVEVKQLNVDRKGNDFESLILSSQYIEPNLSQYIDAFLQEMSQFDSYHNKLLTPYIESKQEVTICEEGSNQTLLNGVAHITWNEMSKNSNDNKIGYERCSYLKSRFLNDNY